MRAPAEALVVLSLLGTAALWRVSAPAAAVRAPACGPVAGVVEDGLERLACLDDPALRPCAEARPGRLYVVSRQGCREAGPLRGPVQRLHALPVDVNRASVEDLRAIEGVGPGLAGRILEVRAAGPFCRESDLERVHGIGPARAAAIAPQVFFESPDCAAQAR